MSATDTAGRAIGSARKSGSGRLPGYSPWLARWFARYLRNYFGRSFHAVRTSGTAPATDRPLIVYSNHPSWWDPIHLFLLAGREVPDRRVYGPMDAEALEQYRIFKRLGVFGVERDSTRGAAAFVRTSRAILAEPGASLWLTAEGEFHDARHRPIRLMSGLGHVAARTTDAWVVPLAIEYPFWNERFPEALSRFGEPFHLAEVPRRTESEWTESFRGRLEETMDALADDAASRDPARFRTLVSGSAGIGGVYDRWRRFRAYAKGDAFRASHGADE